MNNVGYIYKITNKVNNKCYIGQTSKPVQIRWNEHKNDSKKITKGKYNYPLYKAFRKYGLKNFSFEIIEECKIADLDDKEIYWINFYNSYHDGYNQCLGGGGNRTLEINEEEVIKKYEEIKNVSAIANYFHCSNGSIQNILKKYNIDIISAGDHAKEKGYTIYQFDRNHNLLKIFPTILEAAEFILKEGKGTNLKSIRECIRTSMLSNYCTYGYFGGTNENIESYKKEFQEKNRIHNKKYHQETQKPCPLCGNLMSSHSTICKSCHNQQNSDNAIKEKQEKGITREFLKQEIRNNSFTQIGKEQGVSDNAIRKWCKLYNLPSKSSEIKKYSDEEWENI